MASRTSCGLSEQFINQIHVSLGDEYEQLGDDKAPIRVIIMDLWWRTTHSSKELGIFAYYIVGTLEQLRQLSRVQRSHFHTSKRCQVSKILY